MNRKTKMHRKTKISTWAIAFLGVIFVFLYFFLGISVLFSSSSDDLEFKGTYPPEKFTKNYGIHLPEESLSVDYFQEGGRALFARIKISKFKNEEGILIDFQKMSGRNSVYKKNDLNEAFIPTDVPEAWWDPDIIRKCEYYRSKMGYRDPMFWIDRENKLIYMFYGN